MFSLRPIRVIIRLPKKEAAAEQTKDYGQDTFEDGDYTNDPTWLLVDAGGGTGGVAAAAKKNGVYGFRFTTSGDNDLQSVYLRRDYEVESINVWAYIRSSDVSEACICYAVLDFADRQCAQLAIDHGTFKYASGVFGTLTAVPEDNTWYRFRLQWNKATNKCNVYVYAADGTTLIESKLNIDAVTDGNFPTSRVALECVDHSATVVNNDFDDVCYEDAEEPE